MVITAMVDGLVNAKRHRNYSISELKVLLTDRCNLSCTYCPVIKGNNELVVSSVVDGINDFLAVCGRPAQISFSGGEPLLIFSSLADIVERFSCQNIRFTLVTNGTIAAQNIISFLKSHRFEIKISIDGNPVSHNRNRILVEKGSFSLVRKGLMRYMKGGYPVKTNMVFTPSNVLSLVDNLKYISNMGVSHINIQPDIIGLWHDDALRDASVAFEEFIKYYISLFRNNGRRFIIPSLRGLMGRSLYAKKTCHKISLFPDGKYYICDRVIWLSEKERSHFCVGTSGEGIDFNRRETLFNELSAQIKEETSSLCRKCNLSFFCQCRIGGFVACLHSGIPYREYFKGFCALSRIYLNSYLKIFSSLRSTPEFIAAYA